MLITDPLERKTEYVYDSRNRLVSTILPDGSVISSSYDFDNNPTVSLDGNGNRTRSFYDSRGRLTSSIDALGNETSYQYDAANQLVGVVDANGHRTQYEYDELGRQVAVIDAAGNVSRTSYDKAGNVVAEIDANGNTTYFQYDALNRQIAVTDAEGGTTSTTYDLNGNVLSITDPVNNRTSYIYDARNRLVSETNQLGNTRSFEYDGVGNRLSTTDRNGRVREFTYDGLNRLISENWLDTVGNTIHTISNSYDAASQLIAVRDPDSSYSYSYDELRRLLTIDNGGTPGVPNVVLTYSYDGNGNIISVRDAIDGEAAGITTYTYDELDRVTQITQTGNEVADKRVDFRYDAIGQIELISRYSDLDGTQLVVGSDYTYDSLNRLTNLTHSNNTSTVALEDFVYDGASRITQITDIDGVTDYSYDDRNQLTGAERSDSNNPDESYSYDANGNRLSSSFHEDDYVTGENNQLESDGIYNYEYDLEGNLIRQTEIATGAVREFEWDYRNRLVALVDEDALAEVTQSVSYTYDALNRRISKTVDGIVTYFVHDSYDSLSNVALEFGDEDGVAGSVEPVLTQRYVHGSRVDQVLAQEDDDGNLLWHLGDHLGTIRDLVDNSGEVMNHYIYDSFGNVIAQTDNTVENRRLFTGREFDFETGLLYYRARYYDSPTGRFIGLDPIGFGGEDWNLYRYVGNSPVDLIDPSGLDVWIEGPSGDEPPFHQSINVGDPNGQYTSFSFGTTLPNLLTRLSGSVYIDDVLGGKIEKYLRTTPQQDAEILARLWGQVGNSGPYLIITENCRTYSNSQFDEIKQRYDLRELSEQEIEAIQRDIIPREFPTRIVSPTTGGSSYLGSRRSGPSTTRSSSSSTTSSSSSTTNSSSSDHYPSPSGPTVPVPRY